MHVGEGMGNLLQVMALAIIIQCHYRLVFTLILVAISYKAMFNIIYLFLNDRGTAPSSEH